MRFYPFLMIFKPSFCFLTTKLFRLQKITVTESYEIIDIKQFDDCAKVCAFSSGCGHET